VDIRLLAGIVDAVVALWLVLLLVFWLLRPKGVSVRELVRIVPDAVRLIRGLVGDRTVPADVRAVLVALLVWIISPVDLIPEFVPALGPIDDVIVAIVAMRYVRRRLGIHELRSRWQGTDDGFAMLIKVMGTG
jgi:uncharacterized membrane protein YkvA (DUF1232 family)